MNAPLRRFTHCAWYLIYYSGTARGEPVVSGSSPQPLKKFPDAPLSYENIVRNKRYIDRGLQALPYVALLIAMLFFVYAVIGMQVGLMFS